MDPALKALKQVVIALENCPMDMRIPTLHFAADRYGFKVVPR